MTDTEKLMAAFDKAMTGDYTALAELGIAVYKTETIVVDSID